MTNQNKHGKKQASAVFRAKDMTNNITFKSDLLKNAVELAKDRGFNVYAFQKAEPISQVFITNNNGVCTVSCEYHYGLNIGACHKPCRDFGTGFRLNEEPITEIHIEDITKAIQCIKPYWAKKGGVFKYRDWDDYLKTRTTLNYFEI